MADTSGGFLSVQGTTDSPLAVYTVKVLKANGVVNGQIGVIMRDWNAYVGSADFLSGGQDENGNLTALASGVGYYNAPALGISNRPVTLSVSASRTPAGVSSVTVTVTDWHTGEVLYTSAAPATMTRGGAAIVRQQGPAAA